MTILVIAIRVKPSSTTTGSSASKCGDSTSYGEIRNYAHSRTARGIN